MKFSYKRFLWLVVIAFLFALSSIPVVRAGTTNLFDYAYVGGTTNGRTFTASGVYIPPQKFLVQSGGITNDLPNLIGTNVVAVYIEFSVDAANSNWVTLAT